MSIAAESREDMQTASDRHPRQSHHRPPRICFVGPDNLPALAPEYARGSMGGAQLQQVLLARGLLRHGFDVSMVVVDQGQPEGASWSGIRTHKAYPPAGGLPVMRFVHPRLTGIWSAMRRAAADIYYCSCAGLLPGQLAMFAKWARRPVRTVYRMAHDHDARPHDLRIPNRRGEWLYRYGLPRMDLILAQTEAQQTEMLANFGLASRVIRSLVDLPELRDDRPRDIDALWVSNIRPIKRPEMYLSLAEGMPGAHMHMAGGTQPGHERQYAAIQERARQIASLTFHGPVPYDVTNQLLLRTRVLVNTSQSEGFPNTYLQAWARGVPVVGTFDPDGVIRREGLGFAVDDVQGMRGAVASLLSGDARWTETSRRCLDYVQRVHGEGAISQYAGVLGALASQHARAGLT